MEFHWVEELNSVIIPISTFDSALINQRTVPLATCLPVLMHYNLWKMILYTEEVIKE